jgi:hypothetical protein
LRDLGLDELISLISLDVPEKEPSGVGLSEDGRIDHTRDGTAWRGVFGAAVVLGAPNDTELKKL